MTGTWPHINGCTRNSVPLDRRFRVFPELMQDRDYRTGYIGKWHLGEDGPAGRGFQHWISTDDHGDYYKIPRVKGPCARQTERTILGSSRQQSADRVVRGQSFSRNTRATSSRNISAILSFWWLRSWNHILPTTVRSTMSNPLDEVELDATATLPEHEGIPLRYRLMREWQQAEALLDRERLPIQLFFGITPDEYRSIKQRYLGLVTLVDQSIGAILGCLERCGITDDTRSWCTRATTATASARIISLEKRRCSKKPRAFRG